MFTKKACIIFTQVFALNTTIDPHLNVCFCLIVDDVNSEHLNNSLYNWINEERFETFPKITKGSINEILQTKKYLVLVVVEENKLQQIPADMLEFRDMVESVIRKNRDKYHKTFQFGWIGSPDLANSIAMTVLPLPHLLVLNSTTNHHHFPEDDPKQLTAEALHLFLDKIANQSVPVSGSLMNNIWFSKLSFRLMEEIV